MIRTHLCLVLLTVLSIILLVSCEQIYPGTVNRPILSDEEAGRLTIEKYLSPWSPNTIEIPKTDDYLVGKTGDFQSVQEAINAVVRQNTNSTERKYIIVTEGEYEETVYIPGVAPPLTLIGYNARISLDLSANLIVEDWINKVNPNGSRYKKGDPAYKMYKTCAESEAETVGTSCSSVVWNKSDKLQLINITFENSAFDAQAVAFKIEADEVQLENVRLVGHQDTIYINYGTMFINNSYIEGSTDYICGGGTIVFNNCLFYTISIHKNTTGVLFAPKTLPSNSYGYLVMNSILTTDDGFLNSSKVRLARSWDSTEYVPGVTPNGQLLIRNSRIDSMINVTGPWDKGIGSKREYVGNIDPNRNLDDSNYNRFWEYQNFGGGA